jgi:hypothetical protein
MERAAAFAAAIRIQAPNRGDDRGSAGRSPRPLGKKTLEAEILKEALEHAAGSKKQLRLPPSLPKDGSR